MVPFEPRRFRPFATFHHLYPQDGLHSHHLQGVDMCMAPAYEYEAPHKHLVASQDPARGGRFQVTRCTRFRGERVERARWSALEGRYLHSPPYPCPLPPSLSRYTRAHGIFCGRHQWWLTRGPVRTRHRYSWGQYDEIGSRYRIMLQYRRTCFRRCFEYDE